MLFAYELRTQIEWQGEKKFHQPCSSPHLRAEVLTFTWGQQQTEKLLTYTLDGGWNVALLQFREDKKCVNDGKWLPSIISQPGETQDREEQMSAPFEM